jgi:16S rRNA (uracil1498-N3)-methyltransferase
METRRIYVPDDAGASRVHLEGEAGHYLARVLRARHGDKVVLFRGDGNDYEYRVEACRKDRVDLALEGGYAVTTDPVAPLALVQAYLKTGGMDDVLRAATALGITVFVPFLATRSVGKPAKAHAERWRRVAINATQQSGRTQVPEIMPVSLCFEEALARLEPDRFPDRICYWEGARGDRATTMRSGAVGRLVAIGPEGGLTEVEVETAAQAGCRAGSLGPRVLRAELAPVVALAWCLSAS